jgi:GntR family transcriptional regulator
MKRQVKIPSDAVDQDNGAVGSPRRKPLYQHVVNILRDEIVKGLFPVGSLLPTEEDLSERFSVSRHTVREALRHLRNDGLVTSRQGAGTTVARPGGNVYVQEIKSISDIIQYAETVRYRVERSEIVASDAALVRQIGGSEGQQWLRVEGLRYSDESEDPVCRTIVYVNADYAGVGRLIARRNGAIYEMIEDLYG